ncbi:hypothetical protein [Candidatus Laterigemmans baculatus]|uniref:hypothetical protein n=1 Tax=Candidatus Laterigemmans baculatus TaxID=2770505 RepID=UPI00193B1FB6|nr:hypothetical protein [Candidatus Laterigemmans baculatus]
MAEARIEASQKPVKCPKCGGQPVARIVYGLPHFSDELEQEIQSGKTVLGGCCISGDDPEWQCTQFDQNIYLKQE